MSHRPVKIVSELQDERIKINARKKILNRNLNFKKYFFFYFRGIEQSENDGTINNSIPC